MDDEAERRGAGYPGPVQCRACVAARCPVGPSSDHPPVVVAGGFFVVVAGGLVVPAGGFTGVFGFTTGLTGWFTGGLSGVLTGVCTTEGLTAGGLVVAVPAGVPTPNIAVPVPALPSSGTPRTRPSDSRRNTGFGFGTMPIPSARSDRFCGDSSVRTCFSNCSCWSRS